MLHRQRSCSSEIAQPKRGSLLSKRALEKIIKGCNRLKIWKITAVKRDDRNRPESLHSEHHEPGSWKREKRICLTVSTCENCATVQNDHEVISGCFNKRDARSKDNKYATNKPPCANRYPGFANLYVFLFSSRRQTSPKPKLQWREAQTWSQIARLNGQNKRLGVQQLSQMRYSRDLPPHPEMLKKQWSFSRQLEYNIEKKHT